MARKSGGAQARLSVEDWVTAAMARIAEHGVRKLAIEPLASELGVTKGSFYWHFRGRAGLMDAVLERWRGQGEARLMRDLEKISDPRARLAELFRRVAADTQTYRVHAELLKVLDNPRVREVVESTAESYIEVMVAAYRQMGQSADAALDSARLAYSAYLGFMHMNLVFARNPLRREKYEDYIRHLINTLVPRPELPD